jgi:hypothetical protein
VNDDPVVLAPPPAAGAGWRRAADVTAAVLCVAALVWSFGLGERVPLLAAVDLGFHELGHLVLGWAPGLVPPLAGSLFQVGVPLGLAAYFAFGRREEYAAALMLGWAGTSARDVSVYIADAPFESLPLIGGMHDWAWILGSTQRMGWAGPLAHTVRVSGLLLVCTGLCVALWPFVAAEIQRRQAAADRARLATLPRRDPRNRPSP